MKALENPSRNFIASILPFLAVGIFLAFLVIAIVVLSYVFIFGSLIGLILFIIAYIKRRWFSGNNKDLQRQPKVYNHEEL